MTRKMAAAPEPNIDGVKEGFDELVGQHFSTQTALASARVREMNAAELALVRDAADAYGLAARTELAARQRGKTGRVD